MGRNCDRLSRPYPAHDAWGIAVRRQRATSSQGRADSAPWSHDGYYELYPDAVGGAGSAEAPSVVAPASPDPLDCVALTGTEATSAATVPARADSCVPPSPERFGLPAQAFRIDAMIGEQLQRLRSFRAAHQGRRRTEQEEAAFLAELQTRSAALNELMNAQEALWRSPPTDVGGGTLPPVEHPFPAPTGALSGHPARAAAAAPNEATSLLQTLQRFAERGGLPSAGRQCRARRSDRAGGIHRGGTPRRIPDHRTQRTSTQQSRHQGGAGISPSRVSANEHCTVARGAMGRGQPD